MQHNNICKRKPRNMRLSWLSRCNFYFCLCHKLALWPWASHQISLTHANISEKGYCKALISADDYCTHKSSSSFSSLFSSLAISLSFQRWNRKLSGSTQNRYFFRGKKPEPTLLCPQVLPVPSRSLWICDRHSTAATRAEGHLSLLRTQLTVLTTVLGHTK